MARSRGITESRFGLALSVLLTLALTESAAEAITYSQIDRLRILNQNIANIPSPFTTAVGPCDDDVECRATRVARRVKESDYDVVVFEEQFDEDSMKTLISELGDQFPYHVGLFETRPIGEDWLDDWIPKYVYALNPDPLVALAATEVSESVVLQNSGLAIFSKWPIIPFPNGGVSSGETIPFMDDLTFGKVFDNPLTGLPVSFIRYDQCYFPYKGPGLYPEPYEVMGQFDEMSDCFASKGIAAVRLLSPTNRTYTVMFTHTQAAYASVYEQTRSIRAVQMQQVQSFIQAHGLDLTHEELVLTGDLNINGDQRVTKSGPDWSINPEWTNTFEMGPPPGNDSAPFFSTAPALKDSWPYAMGAHNSSIDASAPGLGVDPGLTWVNQPCLGGCAQTNGRLDYIMIGHTQVNDRLPMAVHHAMVSYNIGNKDGGGINAGITSATSPGHWLHGAVGNISDHWGLSAEIAPETAYHNPAHAYAINPEQMCSVQWCNAGTCSVSNQGCSVDSHCRDCLHVEYNSIRQPGTAQWYKIDSPGTYTFRVNHTIDVWAVNGGSTPSDDGMHHEVYLPTDLSRPLQPFGDFESESDPGGNCDPRGAVRPDPNGSNASGCPFVGPTYKITEAPFYVKVWYQGADVLAQDYPFPYDFTWQRNNGETKGQAVPMYPSEKLSDADATWPSNGAPERWYAIRVDRAESEEKQHIRIDVNSTLSNGIPFLSSIALAGAAGPQLVGTDNYIVYPVSGAPDRAHFQMFSGNNVPQGGTSLGYLDGDDLKYYVHVLRNTQLPPQSFPFQVRWDTDLTWIMGSAHAHSLPGQAPVGDWHLDLNGQTEDDDNIVDVHDEVGLEFTADSSQYAHGVCDQDHQVGDGEDFIELYLCGAQNKWSEPLETRRAIRYVRGLQARIWEWDNFLTGDHDSAPWGTMGTLFPETALLPGPPDPNTADKYIVPGVQFHIGWGPDDGNYFWVSNLANSSPDRFCLDVNNNPCAATFECKGSICVKTTTGKDYCDATQPCPTTLQCVNNVCTH